MEELQIAESQITTPKPSVAVCLFVSDFCFYRHLSRSQKVNRFWYCQDLRRLIALRTLSILRSPTAQLPSRKSLQSWSTLESEIHEFGFMAFRGTLLRKALESKRVRTVGDLARLSSKDVSGLPLKPPRGETVVAALECFANDNVVLVILQDFFMAVGVTSTRNEESMCSCNSSQ